MSNVSKKDLEENCSDLTVEVMNLAGRLRVTDKRVKELEHELSQVRTASRQHKERKEFLEIHCDRLDDQIDRLKDQIQELEQQL